MSYAWKPFGLNQIRLATRETPTPTTVVTLAAARRLTFTPRMLTGELQGNDSLLAVASFIEALNWEIEEGGIPVAAMALMLGFTATEAGTTPTRTNTLNLDAGTAMPYFTIYGKSLDEETGDVHVKIWKAKVTGDVTGEFAYGEFRSTGLSGVAVKDGTVGAGVVDIVQNETATTLPEES